MLKMQSLIAKAHTYMIYAAFQLWYGRRPYGKKNRFLQRSLHWDETKITMLQQQRLHDLLSHTFRNIPAYQSFASTYNDSLDPILFLKKLPIQTKKDLQNIEKYACPSVYESGVELNHTGGSTGEPLHFYQDKNFRTWCNADKLRCYQMCGYSIGKPWIFLWGSDYDAKQHKGVLGKFTDRFIYNLDWINTFSINEKLFEQAVTSIRKYKPCLLVAYASSAKLFADFVRSHNISNLTFDAIQTSAEVLTQDDRHYISDTFSCPIFDRYGCREVGNIAHECNVHNGLHILSENVIVEVLDENNEAVSPGNMGRIIVTNLHNYVMPFLRYDTGDYGIISNGKCECGSSLPLIHNIVGRVCDSIRTPSGKILHTEFFTHLFYKTQKIKQFAVVQKNEKDIEITIVPQKGYNSQETTRFLSDIIHKKGDPSFKVFVREVDMIKASHSGKYRFVRSDV